MNSKIITILTIGLFCLSCSEEEIFNEDYYSCNTSSIVNYLDHPKATLYQSILDQNQRLDVVGAVLLVEDPDGLWVGSSGYSDLASNIEMQTCNTFLIASISKTYTATAIYRYIDQGLLSINDTISQYLPSSINDDVANTQIATIGHLLSHRSGIPDFYTDKFDLDRLNAEQSWDKYEVLEYAYGLDSEFTPDSSYSYSNTNYLLLSIILERISGKSLEQIYNEELFEPLSLSTAYYSENQPLPYGVVKGYADIYGNGNFVHSDFLYTEEIGIGGDGGIASNATDLAFFLKTLATGNVISQQSFNQMTNWFDLPNDAQNDDPLIIKNGYGFERVESDYGFGLGHTGGIDGFNTFAYYFPDTDVTYVLLLNSVTAGGTDAPENIFRQTLNTIFN